MFSSPPTRSVIECHRVMVLQKEFVYKYFKNREKYDKKIRLLEVGGGEFGVSSRSAYRGAGDLGAIFYVKVGRHWRHDGQLRSLHLGIFEYSFR